MPSPTHPALDAFVAQITDRLVFAQVIIRRTQKGFELRHVDDPDRLDAVSVGLNHGSWSIRHLYDGQDFIAVLRDAYEHRRMPDTPEDRWETRLVELALEMDALPSHYFQYYYFKDEILAELRAKPTTRAQDIMASVPDY